MKITLNSSKTFLCGKGGIKISKTVYVRFSWQWEEGRGIYCTYCAAWVPSSWMEAVEQHPVVWMGGRGTASGLFDFIPPDSNWEEEELPQGCLISFLLTASGRKRKSLRTVGFPSSWQKVWWRGTASGLFDFLPPDNKREEEEHPQGCFISFLLTARGRKSITRAPTHMQDPMK
jgi:hypothetical protein